MDIEGLRSAADWFSVRDPGRGRAQMGWRTLVGLVAGLAAGYLVAPAVGLPALLGLVFGGLLGLLPGLLVGGAPAGELARHLGWFLPAFALAQLLGIWLAPHKAAGLALIVVVVFLQSYLSRFGADGHYVGIGLFAFYLSGLLVPISLRMYPGALAVAVASVAAIFLARALLCRYRPVRDLRRTQRSFGAACRLGRRRPRADARDAPRPRPVPDRNRCRPATRHPPPGRHRLLTSSAASVATVALTPDGLKRPQA